MEGRKMKTKIYHIKFDNRFATLTEDEYKKLVAKGKKIVVLYIKQVIYDNQNTRVQ